MSEQNIVFRTVIWLLLLLFFCFTAAVAKADTHVPRQYTAENQQDRLPQLRREFADNKIIPSKYELQILLALSHYPELKTVPVEFIVKATKLPISSRPRPTSIFTNRLKRKYIVVIAEYPENITNPLLVANQPFGAQVGIIGHELAHTAEYITKGGVGILGDALCQLSHKCRVKFERATDRRLIDHGLGWLRVEHAAFVRAQFSAQGYQSDGGGGAYMEPDELLAIMQVHPLYQPFPCCAQIAGVHCCRGS